MLRRQGLREHPRGGSAREATMSAKGIKKPGKQRPMHPQPETIRKGYRGSGKLEGKIALISGGDSGIGRAVAVHFAREGADVAVLYLCEDADANDTRDMVEAEGRRCLLVRGDARREALCR